MNSATVEQGACLICRAPTGCFKNGKFKLRCAVHSTCSWVRTGITRPRLPQAIYLARKREWRSLQSQKAGRTLRKPNCGPRGGNRLDTKTCEKLAYSNALQAWRYWLTQRASDDWIKAYYSAAPWKNPRLSDAEQFRLRYELDATFASAQRKRISVRRFTNPTYAAMWSNDGSRRRWWRAASSHDGTVTKPFMKALLSETHCAYCMQRIEGEPHIDHVMPISRGGLHTADNLVLCCSDCNLNKSNHLPLGFMLRAMGNRDTHRAAGPLTRSATCGR